VKAEPSGKRPGIIDKIPSFICRYWAFAMCCDVSQFPDRVKKPKNPPVQQILVLKHLQAIKLGLIAAQWQAMVPEEMADHGLRKAAQPDRREVRELVGILLCLLC
jgi:hypothetical protein